jgi:4-hydroxybenzoate polyprenyltransferase
MNKYISLMRLNKPIGILLLLWPTLWALWLAGNGNPNIFIVGIFILGTIIMRSAGCIINDFADRNFDKHVERTQHRPLSTGKISVKSALILFFVLLACAFALVLLLNRLTIILAFVGAILATLYPFLKRVTHLPQLGLGLAFSWGVPMAFAAINNNVPINAWILFLVAAIWPVIYDTMYAMVDRNDDVTIGIKSTAILFGDADKLIIATLQIIFLLLMIMCGVLFKLTSIYYVSLFISFLLFCYQQWLIKDRDKTLCFKAFLNNHWVGMVIFLGIAL